MAESQVEGWARGYEQAVAVLFDEALADTPRERAAKRAERLRMEASDDYDAVRQIIDEKGADWMMSRAVAQFYLGMSPSVFQKHLRADDHPFAPPRGGATKGQVDDWFARRMGEKHQFPIRGTKLGRDLESKRVYVVDASGAILADAHLPHIPLKDRRLAERLSRGSLRVYSLTQALSMPWVDLEARKPWAHGRIRWLETQLARARAQDLDAALPSPEEGRRARPLGNRRL